MSKEFDNILDECMERLLFKGETVELCLESYPEQAVELKPLLQTALATKRLTEAQRQVISLRFAGELSIAEVARVMGKSQGAVKALQHSAIIALRKALSVA